MLRFGETKVGKEKFYVVKKPIKTCDINFDNIAISKLAETRNHYKYLIGYLDETITQLVLILPKISGYVKTFKKKGGNKNKHNKLMSLCIGDNKLLEKYKTIWAKIEDV